MKYQLNGKMEDDVKKIKGLQDILGIRAKNVFKVESEEELDEKMSDMALVDLQKLAVASGISGGGSRAVLKAKLRAEFSKFKRSGMGCAISKTEPMKLKGKDTKARAQEVNDLMMEGM